MSMMGRAASEGTFFQSLWDAVKEGNLRFWRYVDRAVGDIYNYVKFGRLPLDSHKIMMLTSRGTYNCNPRAIAEEIRRQKLPYTIVWVVRRENLMKFEHYPKNLKLVERGSYEFYEEAATAKVWIDNSVTYSYLYTKKKKGQVLFETWHGSFGLKRFDASVNNNKFWVKKAYQEGKITDYCLTNCKFEEKLFRDTFWKDAEMLPYGHPRNDILFKKNSKAAKKIIAALRKQYKLQEDTHVLLYAPTYREVPNAKLYVLDYEAVVEALRERFGGEWKIMVRYHFLDRKHLELSNTYHPLVINATEYPDIQDLLLITDIGVTDYSSWIYDYFFTEKPGFLYVPDIDGYVTRDREFLFPIETTPFPIAKTNDELCERIRTFDAEKYKRDYQSFYDKMECYEDGHASERLVEKLKEIMG